MMLEVAQPIESGDVTTLPHGQFRPPAVMDRIIPTPVHGPTDGGVTIPVHPIQNPNDTPPGLITAPIWDVAGPNDPNGVGGSSPITTGMGFPGGEPRFVEPVAVTPQPSTPTIAPPAPPNTAGAGLAGNGGLVDALTAMMGGGGFQNPQDASTSPSTAALQALQPTASQTSATSNPAMVYVIVAIAAAIGLWLYTKAKKPHAGH